MADITVTTDEVSDLPQTQTRDAVAGGSGNLGDSVYIAADGDAEQSDASVAGTAVARGVVVAIESGKETFVAGDKLTIAYKGPVSGYAGTPGTTAYVSDTAGALADAAGSVSHVMGYFWAADVLMLDPAVA